MTDMVDPVIALDQPRRSIMKTNSLLKRASAAAVVSAALGLPAFVGLGSGIAGAVPREINCRGMAQAYQSSMHVAEEAGKAGDYYASYRYYAEASAAKQNYDRYCLGQG
jgi:hypothetical protein